MGKNNQNQAFMKGAFILLIANVTVKVIGAGFKIPLTYMIDEEGMGLFSSAYNIYTWLFVVATAGFPVAISKMVAEARARRQVSETRQILRSSLLLMGLIGIVGALFLFFGAGFLSNVMMDPEVKPGIQALSLALLCVSVMSAFRGYFQGHQNMFPTAISEVIEALGKLVFGYTLAMLLLQYGLQYAAAGAVFGVSAGALLGLLFIVWVYWAARKRMNRPQAAAGDFGPTRTSGQILKELVKIAIPITIGASVFSLASVIDSLMIMRRLQEGAGFALEQARSLWGSYSGYAYPLFNMPPTMITAISISLVPAIASALAAGRQRQAQRVTGIALRITILFALPCAVGMAVLAEPILQLVFHNTSATSSLSILAYAIVFVSLVSVTNAMLQASGKIWVPVTHMAIGGLLKVSINYILVGTPEVNINGAPIGSLVCYITILTLNLISIRRIIGVRLGFVDMVFKPVLCVAGMAAVALLVYGNTAFLGNTLSLLLSIALGGGTYLALLFLVGAVREEDVEMLPKSDRYLPLLKKWKLIRK